MSELEAHPDPNRRWRHRRRIAYLCLAAGLLYPFALAGLAAVSAPAAGGVESLAMPFYLFVSAPIAVYIAGATVETIKIGPGK